MTDYAKIVVTAELVAESLFEDPWGDDEGLFTSLVEYLILQQAVWYKENFTDNRYDKAVKYAEEILNEALQSN